MKAEFLAQARATAAFLRCSSRNIQVPLFHFAIAKPVYIDSYTKQRCYIFLQWTWLWISSSCLTEFSYIHIAWGVSIDLLYAIKHASLWFTADLHPPSTRCRHSARHCRKRKPHSQSRTSESLTSELLLLPSNRLVYLLENLHSNVSRVIVNKLHRKKSGR